MTASSILSPNVFITTDVTKEEILQYVFSMIALFICIITMHLYVESFKACAILNIYVLLSLVDLCTALFAAYGFS